MGALPAFQEITVLSYGTVVPLAAKALIMNGFVFCFCLMCGKLFLPAADKILMKYEVIKACGLPYGYHVRMA